MHAVSAFFLHMIDQLGYAGLFLAMTLANIGAPVGSEIILPAAGALVATGHLSNLWLAIAISVGAELFGQSIGYTVGYYGGRPFVERFGKYVRFHHEQLAVVENFFRRYGKFAIFICRFVPVIRGIVGIPAGIAEMPLVPFYAWTFLGSLIFCGGLILLGHALGEHSHAVVASLRRYAIVIFAVLAVAAAVYLAIRTRQARRTAV